MRHIVQSKYLGIMLSVYKSNSLKFIVIALIVITPSVIFSQVEDMLYYNFKPEDNFYIHESDFKNLKKIKIINLDSFDIEMIQYDSSVLINDRLETKILRQGIMHPAIRLYSGDNIADSLNILEFYIIGKLVDKLHCHVSSYIVYVEESQEHTNFKLLFSLNFKNECLKSMLILAYDIYNYGPMESTSYLAGQSCDQQKIKIHSSHAFDCLPYNDDVLHSNTLVKINPQGNIEILEKNIHDE